MSAGDSAKFLAGSPYIRDLAALVVGYGMAINIVEVRERERDRDRDKARARAKGQGTYETGSDCKIHTTNEMPSGETQLTSKVAEPESISLEQIFFFV